MPRFVVLEHDHPRGLHWDFMLEADGVLKTWALAARPNAVVPVRATPLPDHRIEYLGYEGTVSGNRGTVKQWDAGTFEWCSSNERPANSSRDLSEASDVSADLEGIEVGDVRRPRDAAAGPIDQTVNVKLSGRRLKGLATITWRAPPGRDAESDDAGDAAGLAIYMFRRHGLSDSAGC